MYISLAALRLLWFLRRFDQDKDYEFLTEYNDIQCSLTCGLLPLFIGTKMTTIAMMMT